MKLKQRCPVCYGQLAGRPSICPLCEDAGYIYHDIEFPELVDLTATINSHTDKLNDIWDKCLDIKEKCDEIWNKLNE